MTGETDGLHVAASTKEDPATFMSSPDDDQRPDWAMDDIDSVRDARTAEDATSSSLTIEQRYELEKTLVGLELENEQLGVPIGVDDRFVLHELLGRGSMGAVYRAQDVELQRSVAIKVVSRRLEHGRLTLRLRREARALAALDHPNVVKIFDIGKEHGEPFIAMEHVAGTTLRRWQEGRGVESVLDAYLQAGRGLAAAHAHGLVHRDFKPDNAFVDAREGSLRVRVGDFGLVGDEPEDAPTEPDRTGSRQTSHGFMGTPAYMAPEQLRREQADARSDQHQFCVALWEAIAGARPFEPSRPLGGDPGAPPCPQGMPRWLHRVLRRGLAFEAEARHPSMGALLAAIERGRSWQRARPWLAAGGIAIALACTTWVAMQTDPCEMAASPIDSVWSDEARADIEAAFGPRDVEHRGTMTEYLLGRLDHAAAQWSGQAQQVCSDRQHASASERPRLEQRAECLERWVEHLDSRIEWLRHPDPTRMDRAFELVAPLAHAGDSCMLPPPLIDAEVDAAIEEASQAELLRDLDEAKRLATAAVALAETQGTHCHVSGPDGEPRSSELAAALFRLGHVLSERRESKVSLEALERAHEHAHACNDEHRDAEARIHAAKVLALDFEDVAAATIALDDAWVALAHVEEPEVSLRRYEERMAAGLVAEHGHDYDGARRLAEEGRNALGREPRDPVLEARLDLNIGVAYQRQERHAEAAAAYEQAAERVGSALGREHVQTRLYADRRALNLGLAAQAAGDYPRMRQALSEAATSREISVKVKALTAWAQGEHDANDADAALVRTNVLLEFLDGRPDLPPIGLATAELTAGQSLALLGDPRAIPVLERACARWRQSGGPYAIASCELTLGQMLQEAGRTEAARRVLEGLLELKLDAKEPLAAAIDDFRESLKSPRVP